MSSSSEVQICSIQVRLSTEISVRLGHKLFLGSPNVEYPCGTRSRQQKVGHNCRSTKQKQHIRTNPAGVAWAAQYEQKFRFSNFIC